MFAMPIPVPAGTPSWVGVVVLAAAAAGFVVLLWQVVRHFRQNGDD